LEPDIMHRRIACRILVPALLLLVAPVIAAAQAPRAKCGPSRLAVFDSAVLLDSVPGQGAVKGAFDQRALKARNELAQAADSLKLSVDQLARGEATFTLAQREAAMHLLLPGNYSSRTSPGDADVDRSLAR